MAKKSKVEQISSRFFTVLIMKELPPLDRSDLVTIQPTAILSWHVRNNETGSDTEIFTDMDEYRKLKRVWRRSKEDFDSACRFMDYRDLFSQGGKDA